MSAWNLEHLDDLVLARLAVPRRAPYRPAELPKLLGRYLQHAASPAEARALLAASTDRLLAAGLLAPPLALTEAGQARSRALAGGPPPSRWDAMERRSVLAAALGRPGGGRLAERAASAEGLQAILLAEAHALGSPERLTLTQALDALVWQTLGVPDGGRLTPEKLRVWALGRVLGAPQGAQAGAEPASNPAPRPALVAGVRGSSRQLARRAAAVAAGARGTDPAALRQAVIARWLTAGGSSAPRAERAPSDLLAAVRAAARDPATPRYSPRDAFIAGVYDALAHHPARRALSLPDFKAKLVAAHREGALRLARADLVAAMDEGLVARSETTYLNATFHFVEVEP